MVGILAYTGTVFLDDWNFLNTNYIKDEQTPNFEWKVYIPIIEHMGIIMNGKDYVQYDESQKLQSHHSL